MISEWGTKSRKNKKIKREVKKKERKLVLNDPKISNKNHKHVVTLETNKTLNDC